MFYGYFVGEGAGVLNIQAELDDGSLQSETYELYDCIVYDKAITGSKYDGWKYNTTDVSESTTENGTTATNSSASTGRTYWCNRPDTTTTTGSDYQGTICIECDIIESSNDVSIQFGYGSTYGNRTLNLLGLTSGGHLKIEYDGTYAKFYVNGSSTPTYTQTVSMGDNMYEIRFYLPASTSVTYKNFEIYPI